MDRLFLNSADVRSLLHEGKTLFYSDTGSFHHPQFPPPLKRPGRAQLWFRGDIERFAAMLAEGCRDVHGTDSPVPPNIAAQTRRQPGRPRKPRPYASAEAAGDPS